jgi:5'-3' exonuclease
MGHYHGGSVSTAIIIDGNNMAHRARYAFSLSNKGEDVSVLYGFMRMLKKSMERFDPDYAIVCWDGGIPEYRRQRVPEYKANRHLDDDPLEYDIFLSQVQELDIWALPMMGVISVRKSGAEADDLIWHASRLITADKVIIITSDKDLYQAANNRVHIYSPVKDIVYGVDDVEGYAGVPLSNYVDWRALQGDSSDNIAGVKGIGEKTATKLFKEFDTLTGIVNMALGHHPDRAKKMSERLKNNIKEFGFERLINNIYVMNLYFDRVGARISIIEAISDWKPANKIRFKKYLMSKAFASLMDGEFYGMLMKLEQPRYYIKGIRTPVVPPKRVAV